MFNVKYYLILCVVVICTSVCPIISNIKRNGHLCGIETSESLIHRNPWLVYLEYYVKDRLRDYRCAGTLISNRYVITAAHCVRKIKFTRLVARLGEYNLSTDKDCITGVCADPVVSVNVSDIFVHPDYDTKEGDVAILKLEKDAPYTDFIRPICLPSRPVIGNVTLYAAGWGEIPTIGMYSQIKKIIPLPFWSSEQCHKVFDVLPRRVICAGGEEGIDTCRGDSGGTLALVRDRIELAGVTSTGCQQCGTKGFPGVYINIYEYMDWIKLIMQ